MTRRQQQHQPQKQKMQQDKHLLLNQLHEAFVTPLFSKNEPPQGEGDGQGKGIVPHCPLRWMNVLHALNIEEHLPGRPTLLVLDPFLRSYTPVLLPALMNWIQSETDTRELAVIGVQTVDNVILQRDTTLDASSEFRQHVVELRQSILQFNFAKPVVIASKSIAEVFGPANPLSHVRFVLLDHNGTTSHYFHSFQELRDNLCLVVNRLMAAELKREMEQREGEKEEEEGRQKNEQQEHQGVDEFVEVPIDEFYFKNPYLKNLDFIKSRVFNRTEWQSATMPLERLMQPHTVLRFPTHIAANYHNSNILLADSHDNRILIMDRVGRILDTVGSGKYNNHSDGNVEFGGITYRDADLANPQGICVLDHPNASDTDPGVVYFADTGTHSIKCIDLKTKQVSMLFDLIYQDDDGSQSPPYRKRLYRALKQKFIYPNHRMSSTFHMDELLAAKADLEFEMERLEKVPPPIPLLCKSEKDRVKRPQDVIIHYHDGKDMTMYIVDESYENLWRVTNFYDHIEAWRSGKATSKRKLLLERVSPETVHNMSGYDSFTQQYMRSVLGDGIAGDKEMLPGQHMLLEYLFLKYAAIPEVSRHRAYITNNNTFHVCPLNPQRLVKVALHDDQSVNVTSTLLERGASNGALSVFSQKNISTPLGSFNSPTGVALFGDNLFVADTHNHLLRTVELTKSGDPNAVHTLQMKNLNALGFPTMEYRPYLSNHLELNNVTYGMDRIATPENFNLHLDNSMLGFGRVVQIPLEMSLGIDLISLDIEVPSTDDYEFASPVETFNVHSSGPWIHYREVPQLLFLKWKTNPPGVPSIKYPRPLAYAFRKEELYDLLYPNNSADNNVNTINIPFIASGMIGVGQFVVDAVVYLRKKRHSDESMPSQKFHRAPFYAMTPDHDNIDTHSSAPTDARTIIKSIQSPLDTLYFHKNLQTRHVHKWGKGETIAPQTMEVEEMEQLLIDQHDNNKEWNPRFFRSTEKVKFQHHEDLVLIDYIQVRLGVSTDGGQEHIFPIKTRVSVETNASLPPIFARNDYKRQHIGVPESWPEDPCLHVDKEQYNRDPEFVKDIADIGAYTGLISPYPDDKLAEAINEEDFLPVRAG